MDTEYIPDADFAAYVHAIPYGQKSLENIDGSMRWVLTREDGTKYIVRPESSK